MRKLCTILAIGALALTSACTNSGHISPIGQTFCNNSVATLAALDLAEKEANKLPEGIGKDAALAFIATSRAALAACPVSPVPVPVPPPTLAPG